MYKGSRIPRQEETMSAPYSLTECPRFGLSVVDRLLHEQIVQGNFHHFRQEAHITGQFKNLAHVKIEGSVFDSTGHVWTYESELVIDATNGAAKQQLSLRQEPVSKTIASPNWTSGSCKITFSARIGRSETAHFRFELERDLNIKLTPA